MPDSSSLKLERPLPNLTTMLRASRKGLHPARPPMFAAANNLIINTPKRTPTLGTPSGKMSRAGCYPVHRLVSRAIRKRIAMRSAISFGLGLSLAVFAVSSTTAATHKARIQHHYNYDIHAVAKPLVDPPSRRVCDWIGPGGRAVYRCTVVD